MAELRDVRLSARGSGSDAVLTATGRIIWNAAETSLNAAALHIHFWGKDSGLRGRDDNRHGIVIAFTRAPESTLEGGGSTLTLRWDGTGHAFTWRVRNIELDIGGRPRTRRRFNEDAPGPDEIYAYLQVRDRDTGAVLSEQVRTNQVSGRF